MRRTTFIALLAALAVAALAPAAHASPRMYVGAVEDEAKTTDAPVAKAKMDLARLAGFEAIRMTAIWAPGQSRVPASQLEPLRTAANAAHFTGLRMIIAIMSYGSRTTPLTPTARRQFAQFSAHLARELPTVPEFIVGNEPNINRFWMPQFTPRGTSASPGAYVALLAQTYDAIKAVRPGAFVNGGSVSPRGGDDPRSKRHTHSPTKFILEMGLAYRRSLRARPLMDGFVFHPYPENSSTPPNLPHPNSTTIGLADYDKLVSLLGTAFDGTAQRGSRLPIVYGEYGVDTVIPAPKAPKYLAQEHRTTRPVTEARQAETYRQALAMAYCQPNVRGFLVFHVSDERDLRAWQSGVYYADNTPKSSLPLVRAAIRAVRAGTIGECDGTRSLAVPPPPGGYPDAGSGDRWIVVPEPDEGRWVVVPGG